MLWSSAREVFLIDCHAHLADPAFDADRAEVLARARAAGVTAVLVVGQDLPDNERVARLCAAPREDGPRLRACFGLHPDRFADDRAPPDPGEIAAALEQIRAAAPRLAAIGEVGLDRRVVVAADRRRAQATLLEELAGLAAALDLPLNVHSRSAGHYALDLLRACGAKRVLMHAFDGKAGHAQRAAEQDGFLFSIPPSIVRSRQKQKLVRALPLEHLALESDAPVLGPVPGQRNESANLALVVDAIAEIKSVDPRRVEALTTDNARALFRLQ